MTNRQSPPFRPRIHRSGGEERHQNHPDDRTVVDAGIVYELASGTGPSVGLSAGIRNLFDREYQEIYNFPSPGRLFNLGVRAAVGL
jgi:outer membrane receptor protein involved in Fe transport